MKTFCAEISVLWLLAMTTAWADDYKLAETKSGISCVSATGQTTTISADPNSSNPSLSPDGHTVAFVRLEPEAATASADNARSSLWLGDCVTGKSQLLLASKYADNPQNDLSAIDGSEFSLNGGFVYILTSAWATSGAIHQVNIKNGTERFIIDGNSVAVIRHGRYAGYLLVSRHLYRDADNGGAYDPMFVVNPDGKEKFMVPGTDKEDDGGALDRWLKQHG